LGFQHGPRMEARAEGRFQIEVHPHAASVSLFGLDRIVKYKRGTREVRAAGLRRLRGLMLARLPVLDPALPLRLPTVPSRGPLKRWRTGLTRCSVHTSRLIGGTGARSGIASTARRRTAATSWSLLPKVREIILSFPDSYTTPGGGGCSSW
jgi:hypothetical protein